MRQKFQDFIILLKSDRKTQVIIGALVLVVIFLIFGQGNKYVPLPKRKLNQEKSLTPGASEAYNDLITRFNAQMSSMESQLHDTKVALEQQMTQSKEHEQRTAEIFKRILERIAENEAQLVNLPQAGAVPPVEVGDGAADLGADRALEEDELETLGFEEPVVAPPAPPPPRKVAVVGAGDSVRVKLLAGVNAPTDGTPYPVVFKLVGDILGPDGSTLPVGEARLIAAAQGSLTDQRALFRLSSLNLRLPDGRRKVLPVDGWVVGEDGLRGMEGVLIDPLGKVIIGAGIAGGLDGLGTAMANQQIRRQYGPYGQYEEIITGSETKYAVGRAGARAAREWSSIIRQRADQLVPHVSVLSGREGTAVFSKSFLISDLYEALEEGDTNQFASLN